MDRRTFLKSTVVAAGAAASLSFPALAEESSTAKPKAVLKLSCQTGVCPGKSFEEKVDNLEKWGAAGVELGAGFNPSDINKVLQGRKIKVSAICAADGPYIVADEAQRRRAVDNAKKILERAGEVGSTGVIMVPSFNGRKDQLWGGEAHKILVDQLKEMGEHAVKCNCRMLLEPLNKGEAWFLRILAEAAELCRAANSPGAAMMGDFYHMHLEETSDQGAFISAGKYLHHVHLASRTRARILPHQENSDYRDGFIGLKRIGYQDYCSLECGCRGGTNPAEEVPKTFRFLEKQWEEAIV